MNNNIRLLGLLGLTLVSVCSWTPLSGQTINTFSDTVTLTGTGAPWGNASNWTAGIPGLSTTSNQTVVIGTVGANTSQYGIEINTADAPISTPNLSIAG